MASVSRDAKGYRIFFVDADGRRRSLRLAGFSKSKALQVSRHVDELVIAQASAQPIARQTAVWLKEIKKPLHDKLASLGLVELREVADVKGFVAAFITEGRKKDGAPAGKRTIAKWRTTELLL